MQRGLLIIILSIFFISACTMPETNIYSLYLPNPPSPPLLKGGKGGFSSDASIVIRMHSPRYLTQSYIAYRYSPYQLEISRYSKWESPPGDMVKEAFKDSLSTTGLFKEVRVLNTISGEFYSLEINLKRFEGYDAGNDSFGELLFDVNLFSPDGRELYIGTISKKVKLDDRGFLSLAKGLSSALTEGIGEVRNNIVIQIKK